MTALSAPPRTLFAKVWDSHVMASPDDAPAVLYIDLHLVHEVTSPQAFAELRARGLRVRRPDKTVATMDHATPTRAGGLALVDDMAREQLRQLEVNCAEHGITLHALGSPGQGIAHVIGPEQGLTQPGMTIVCGDSHTSTHGAFGALAFGIGTSEVLHVLATQCLWQRRPRTMRVTFDGRPPPGVTAKDLILAMIAKIGIGGANGHVIEYAGEAIRALDMEGRMTVCNMSIEAGARAGMIAPDDTTFAYLADRAHAPRGAAFEGAVRAWRALATDDGAVFDRELHIDATAIEPMITWGTNPGQGVGISQPVPDPAQADDAEARAAIESALRYTQVRPGQPLLGVPVDVVFIGSCTNGRIGDLRAAAQILRGRRVAPSVRMLVVPGSVQVKLQAEAEGLDRVFRDAGAEWREPGCSMCIAMNGDELRPGQLAVSTSNRNFEGRQGKGGRSLLASPMTAAAAAVAGHVTDPRTLMPLMSKTPELHPSRSPAWVASSQGALNASAPRAAYVDRNSDPRSAVAMVGPRFTQLTSRVVVVLDTDIDTDQIVPARYLKVTDKAGLGEALFADWRTRPGFPIGTPESAGAQILLAGNNFGCGSSREHAPWALVGGGFRAVVSTAFADIFRANALKNGLVPVVISPDVHARLVAARAADPALEITIDLETQVLRAPGVPDTAFTVDGFARRCLLDGVDELGLLVRCLPDVARHEQEVRA